MVYDLITTPKHHTVSLPAARKNIHDLLMTMLPSTFVDWRLNRKAKHLSSNARRQCQQHALLSTLFVTGVGHITRGLGHRFERQTIDEYILLYCVEGQGWLRSGSVIHPMQSGDVGIVLLGTPHAYGADDADPWSLYWAHFGGSQVAAFLDPLGLTRDAPVLSLASHEWSSLAQSFKAMLALLNVDTSFPYLLNAGVYLRQILSTLVLARVATPPSHDEVTEVEAAIQFMHANITGTLRLEDLALRVHLSPSHFCRLFREQTGRAPIDYFIWLKIGRACELLDNTDMKVGEIAHFLGYHDTHYFSRQFKQITGQSPRAFRSACRAGQRGMGYHT